MAKEFGPGRNYTFLRLNSKGELYTGSSEAKEGYNPVELKDGKITYQKAFKSTDYGKVTYLGIEEKEFSSGKVKYVQMSILSEDETCVDVIQLPLKNAKGGMTDEVKKLIATLPSLDYSQTLIVSSNREKNPRGYVDKLLYFRYKVEGDEKDEPIKFSLKFGESGNVPMFTVDEDPITPGAKTYDYKAQDRFLSQVLKYELDRFEAFKKGDVYESEYFKVWAPVEATSGTPKAEAPTEKAKPAAAKPEPVKAEPIKEANPFEGGVDEEDESPF